ncbi:hypothetical protein WICPIJ_006441 [Wickerhamomyces pijperi]|uniref:Uncharacterized protein n=1 Tax=Wickerhamomyces pijperi TaxID=599730 RepID=A0A9P8Q3Q2_WICPI|nr:hypothetical protein WICPIJ_006441 [Wickerhamomyces pijperi]
MEIDLSTNLACVVNAMDTSIPRSFELLGVDNDLTVEAGTLRSPEVDWRAVEDLTVCMTLNEDCLVERNSSSSWEKLGIILESVILGMVSDLLVNYSRCQAAYEFSCEI